MSIDARALNQLDNLPGLPPGNLSGNSPGVVPSLTPQRTTGATNMPEAIERTRARKGEWEEAYFAALRTGRYSKKSAAAIAGVSEEAPRKRRHEDPEFAEREEVANGLRQSWWEGAAMDRVMDGNERCPPDKIITYMLGVLGLNPKHIVETSGPNGGPQQVQVTGSQFNIDELPTPIKQRAVQLMEELESIVATYGGRGSTNALSAPVPTRVVDNSGARALGGTEANSGGEAARAPIPVPVIDVTPTPAQVRPRVPRVPRVPRPLVRLPI